MTGLGTDGRRWQAWLNPDVAAALLVETPEDLDDEALWLDTPEFDEAVKRKRVEIEASVPTGAEGALAWAEAAGIPTGGQQSRIEELLRSRETFVEDIFDALLGELGFPRATRPSTGP